MTLPQGWVETNIEDVVDPMEAADPAAHPQTSFRYIDIGSIDNTTQTIRDPKVLSGAEAPSRARRRVRKGDVLFATVRPYLKNIAQVPPELDGEVTSTGICVLRPASGIEPGYLLRRVISADFIDAMTLASDGTMYPAIADRDVQAGSIVVPPAAEQRRIIAKLDALTVRLTRARAELDRVPVLAAKLRDESYTRLWSAPSRRGLGSLLAGPVRNGLSVAGSDQPPGVPALRLSALRGDRVNLNDVRFLPITEDRAAAYRLRRHDLLVSRGNGTLSLVGKAALVVAEDKGVLPIFPDTAFRIRVDTGTASPKWLLHVWNSPQLRYQIEAVARTTAGIWKIAQRDLMSLAFPDVKVEAQHEVAVRVEADLARADRIEAEAARARALIDRLEAAILAKAFRGELVPQDPNDEAASVLLERIRAQRAAAPKTRRGRRAKAKA